MFATKHVKQKVRTEVELALNDGTTLTGKFFTSPNERLIDMLNDSRAFLPFGGSDGVVAMVSKSIITRITLIDQKTGTSRLPTEETPTHIGQ